MPSTRKLTWEMRLNHLCMRARDGLMTLFPFLLDPYPVRAVAFETTTECTRKCAYCPPHSSLAIPPLRMPAGIFRRVIGSLAGRGFGGNVFFNLYGESLADERLEAWIAEARAKLPSATLIVFTNGDLLTAERFLSLKKAGMDTMVLSQHSAELRPELAAALETLKSGYPELYCVTVIDYHGQYYGGRGIGLLNNKGGLADVRRRPYRHCCDVESAAIDCLGNVLLCNNDCTSSYVFGNVSEKDFHRIWEDPLFAGVRRRIMRGERVFEICRRCMSAEGLTTAAPRGKAARLPKAFHDMGRVLAALKARK